MFFRGAILCAETVLRGSVWWLCCCFVWLCLLWSAGLGMAPFCGAVCWGLARRCACSCRHVFLWGNVSSKSSDKVWWLALRWSSVFTQCLLLFWVRLLGCRPRFWFQLSSLCSWRALRYAWIGRVLLTPADDVCRLFREKCVAASLSGVSSQIVPCLDSNVSPRERFL